MTDFRLRAASSKEMTLLVSLAEIAEQIELSLEEKLQPPPAGIYVNTKLEPVMVANNNYYYIANDEFTLVTDINEVGGAVYNAKHEKILTSSQLKNKNTTLSNNSFFPYRGIKIARLMYEYAIESKVMWRKSRSMAYDKIQQRHISIAIEYEELMRLLCDFQSKINEDLAPLIIDHEWSTFMLKDKLVHDLQITRGEDYRVTWFMQELANGNIKL